MGGNRNKRGGRELSSAQPYGWLSDDRNVFLGKELLHYKRCVARCIIVMQKALSLPLSPKCIAQRLQVLHVEMTSDIMFRRFEIKTVDIKEFWKFFTSPRALKI
jgi:hypothetical protein